LIIPPVELLIIPSALMIINGKTMTKAGSYFKKFNPANGELLAEVPNASVSDLDLAVTSSREVLLYFNSMEPIDREHLILQAVAVLEHERKQLCELLTREQGKPLADSHNEFNAALATLKKAAHHRVKDKLLDETAEYQIIVHYEPVGVVAAILPWNYPFFLCVDKIARSLAHGNSIIIKPSPHTPLTALRIGELLNKVLPPGLVNVLTSEDSAQMNLGALICEHPGINKICFVGSTVTGQKILRTCADTVKRCTVEMGGNDACIILADVDIKEAAKRVVKAALTNNGQICVAPKRIYVHSSIFNDFVSEMTTVIESKIIGNGLSEEHPVDLGPINNRMQYEKLQMFYKDAVENGAKPIHRGIKPVSGTIHPEGLFLEPTIFVGMDESKSKIVNDEQFGPYIPVMPFNSVDEAVEKANNSLYGLGASVFSNNVSLANQIAYRLGAGTVWVNEHIGALGDAPVGGMKYSGSGREGDWAEADLNTYTETKVLKLAK
jgi:acyl-CoA reductase-like NAD-dependent aldehyde dehydrogenase